jgi:hypothetical protein
MVGIHPDADEGRHVQCSGAGMDLGGSAQSHSLFSGKKIHCVNTQGFVPAVLRTIDRDQFGLSVFRQAQTELE